MFLDKLRRVTSSSFYMPHIDGLRFLAIFLVVVQMHVPYYINKELLNGTFIRNSFLQTWVLEGNNGVYLFFVISGFILGLPFAKAFIKNEGKVSLKGYYLRRLTRLEPPYLLVLTVLFLAHIFIVEKFTFVELWPHFVASFFYQHLLYYSHFPLVMPIAWSLEIEVQFYLLAPLFCCVFLIKRQFLRIFIYSVFIAMGIYVEETHLFRSLNLFYFLEFFIGGLLLADLQVTGQRLIRNLQWSTLVAVIMLFSFLSIIGGQTGGYLFSVKFLILLFFFHLVLTNEYFKRLFSNKYLALIGGMCYSIYLTHFTVLSVAGAIIKRLNYPNNLYMGIIYFIILTLVILLFAAIFFYFIEKPFMKLNRAKS